MGEEQHERDTLSEAESPADDTSQSVTDWQSLAEERWDTILRLRADFDNFRRRMDRERDELRALVAEQILARFLSVYDNLDRALRAIPDGDETRAYRTGIEMTRKSFLELLRQEGVEPVATVGESFDPTIHEAIARVASEMPDGTVLDEVQAGFRWKNRVLRAALVRVSAGPDVDGAPEAAPGAAGSDESVEAEREQGGDAHGGA